MMFSRLILLVGIGILSHFVSSIHGHAYFSDPKPRNAYCTNSSCTSNGTLKFQGPIWILPANKTLDEASPTTQKTCNGSNLSLNASIGDTFDPGFTGTPSVSWKAGSQQTLKIFISHLHPQEDQKVYPTDGWQIRYRDATKSDLKFMPINFTYSGGPDTASSGPAPAAKFKLGETIDVKIIVPSEATTNGVFQFFWRNNEASPGLMWLSCVDVTITSLGTITVSSSFIIVVAALIVVVNALFNM